MKISRDWLSDFLDWIETDPEVMADRITRGMGEVDEIEKPGALMKSLTDVIFNIDNHAITNRPDLFSHIGVARELVALGLATWKKKPQIPAVEFPTANLPFKLTNEVPDLIPYYEAALLHVDGSGKSPEWMQRRLTATGWRPINLIVDVTNYVLMEIGMPLHAFDANDFRGDLHIRKAKKGEPITTLDKTTHELPEGSLIISDDDGIFDLFGVMGGLRTSNKLTTRNVFLQAGIIDPVSVRRTVTGVGHRTDAATVYEKGILPITASFGLRRAIELLTEHAPNCTTTSKLVTWGKSETQKPVKANLTKILGYIGASINAKTVKKILTDLGCEVKGDGATLTVNPPAWRRDITHVQDLTEEVARIYGYENVVPVMPEAFIMPPNRDHRMNVIRDSLKEECCTELLHLAFTSPVMIKRAGLDPSKSVIIENPIGEELSRMRTSLLPALLETAGRELTRGESSLLKVFEFGQVFAPDQERAELTTLTAAKAKTTLKNDPLLLTKADLTNALKKAGYNLTFSQIKEDLPAYAHTGRSAVIGCKGKTVGLLTEVLPNIRQAFDLPGRAATAIIDLDALMKIKPDVLLPSPLPAFPAIEFDETLIIPKIAFVTIVGNLLKIDSLLRSIVVVDLYDGEGGKTMTLRFTYRADNRTLTQEEVEKIHAKILEELKKI